MLSPNDVAGLLGLSRPFVARLLDEGKIASRQLAEGSSHRVVRLADVEQFKARREHRAEGRRKRHEGAVPVLGHGSPAGPHRERGTRARLVRAYFGDSRIPENAYAHLVDEAPSNDPDDRRHIAAALAAGADVIVTNNLADFPSEPLALLGLRVMTADEYLCELFGSARTEVITTIRRLAREKRNPPMTPMDLLARIGKIAPEFFGLAKRHFKET